MADGGLRADLCFYPDCHLPEPAHRFQVDCLAAGGGSPQAAADEKRLQCPSGPAESPFSLQQSECAEVNDPLRPGGGGSLHPEFHRYLPVCVAEPRPDDGLPGGGAGVHQELPGAAPGTAGGGPAGDGRRGSCAESPADSSLVAAVAGRKCHQAQRGIHRPAAEPEDLHFGGIDQRGKQHTGQGDLLFDREGTGQPDGAL